ncbi:MAG: hypothetical protein FNT15_07075 [Sulfurovum sp.]|nr:MAG: hypothetical protein FNT15_07075 [Sulfurovum sp.]
MSQKVIYYVYTNHKTGLDSLKKACALVQTFKDKSDYSVHLYVNDFRAGLVAREFGVSGATTIESILDLDMVINRGDLLFIDSPEDDRGAMEEFVGECKQVCKIAQDCDEVSRFGEIILPKKIVVDEIYFKDIASKVDRCVFFLSDSDHDKTIFNHKSFFQNLKMELILGHYFFVGYEDALKEIFSVIHEADEYQELIRTSASVVTSSVQTALEAKMSGAKVIFLEKEKLSNCDNTLLESINISIVYNFNLKQLENVITSMFPKYT